MRRPHAAAQPSLPALASALPGRAASTPVADIMTRHVVCVAPSARVKAAAAMFLERGLNTAPVVNARWQPIGMLSRDDLLRALSEGLQEAPEGVPPDADGGAVGAIVDPLVVSLHEDAPIALAAALMAYEGLHRLPVLAPSGAVAGMVSALDIVRWEAQAAGSGGAPNA